MLGTRLVLAALAAGAAWGQAPVYSASNIVNTSDSAPGPFAPNSVLSIFGTDLAWSERALVSSDIVNDTLPTRLNGVSVYVDNWPAPLLYVSPTQINFIIPGNEISGDVPIRVVREGVTGPEVWVTLVDAAPALFATDGGYAIATHWDGATLLTPDSPAHAGDIVVIYATGFGKTQPNPAPGALLPTAALIVGLDSLEVYLDSVPVDPARIFYAGITPLSVGLYQINLQLPDNVGADPEVRVSVAGQRSSAGLRLVVR
ncbi:MAG TPA: IPT/TIG domain-containing protein [Bryobacteraceae bacterium]|nr:IPT/TIG domain-containing protein [Bryobacteraceae bacterium]